MNKEKEMAEARAKQAREMLRDTIALSVLSSLIQTKGDTQSKKNLCLEAYEYSEEMLDARDKFR